MWATKEDNKEGYWESHHGSYINRTMQKKLNVNEIKFSPHIPLIKILHPTGLTKIESNVTLLIELTIVDFR